MPLPISPGVTPNAAKDQEWRQEAGHGYPGILAAGVSEPLRTTIVGAAVGRSCEGGAIRRTIVGRAISRSC